MAAPPAPDSRDRELLGAVQDGLPLVSRPFAAIGARVRMPEHEVIARLARLRAAGVLKRFGVVVRHHELGYTANAMVVWNVPDGEVDYLGQCLSKFEFITLCYRRARAMPDWPYNLYCMIHGQDRAAVLEKVAFLVKSCGLEAIERAVLFSRRRFKQCGARYLPGQTGDVPAASPDTDCQGPSRHGRR
jgi:DNA-binding Lrp family transcriptional regulator